jgi:bis(5'-nucleosyl)-tetraphosphatase (symmetrical)
MATYAVGDIQGCYDSFSRLLDHVAFDPGVDVLWVVGDVVNRGPKSLKVLRWMKDHQDCIVMVLGNHDLHLLAAGHGLREKRDRDTFKKTLKASDRDELLDWLRHRPFAHRQDGWLMVHAGLWPSWSIDDALACASEAEAMLRADDWTDALGATYRDSPSAWDPSLTGHERFSAIVHGLTQLRYVTSDGASTQGHLGPGWGDAGDAVPWFLAPGRPERKETLLFGHWSTLGLHVADGVVALDSGCVYGRHLTALRLDDRAVFQVPAAEE